MDLTGGLGSRISNDKIEPFGHHVPQQLGAAGGDIFIVEEIFLVDAPFKIVVTTELQIRTFMDRADTKSWLMNPLFNLVVARFVPYWWCIRPCNLLPSSIPQPRLEPRLTSLTMQRSHIICYA